MYDAKYIDGELKLYATMSLVNNQKAMTIEEMVTDIWKNYIQIYLERQKMLHMRKLIAEEYRRFKDIKQIRKDGSELSL